MELVPFPNAHILVMDGRAPITGSRGQPGVAIEKFKRASQKNPHFANPPEG
jgi:hypothetical protein